MKPLLIFQRASSIKNKDAIEQKSPHRGGLMGALSRSTFAWLTCLRVGYPLTRGIAAKTWLAWAFG